LVSNNENLDSIEMTSSITDSPTSITDLMDSTTNSISIDEFMQKLEYQDKTGWKEKMEFLMREYGTKNYCNRFGIGNCNEYGIRDVMKAAGFEVIHLENAKRVDFLVKDFGEFSLKLSFTGNIKLHNSNRQINKDMNMCDTLLITENEWWFLRPSEIERYGVPLSENRNLNCKGDGLELKRSVLHELRLRHYPYFFRFCLQTHKHDCKNKNINEIIYHSILPISKLKMKMKID